MPGKLYVISGPSGAGKSTVIRQLMTEVENMR
jgi:guanylate kinase